MDNEVIRYAQWLSSQASLASSVDQKLTNLSKRTAAELRRAERERGDHTRRLEALEEAMQQYLGGVDVDGRHCGERKGTSLEVERAVKEMRMHFERELECVSEVVQQTCDDARSGHERSSSLIQALTERVDADHEYLGELKGWRRRAEGILENVATERNTIEIGHAADRLVEQLEARWETVLARDRRDAQERLAESCSELTAHLNELRVELLEQRGAVEQQHERLEIWRREELGAQRAGLEAQIEDLGGTIARRLQAKFAAAERSLNQKIDEVRKELDATLGTVNDRAATVELTAEKAGSQVELWREEAAAALVKHPSGHVLEVASQAVEVARDEIRTVHLEVMSLDTRIAAIEERYASDARLSRHGSPLLTPTSAATTAVPAATAPQAASAECGSSGGGLAWARRDIVPELDLLRHSSHSLQRAGLP